MRIAMVGNFTQQHCSENHWALTLEDLGHEVTRIQENEIRPGVSRRVVGHDLFIWVRTWDGFVTHEDLNEIRDLGIPSVSYHLDLFIGLDRGNGLDTDPRWRCDFVFTPDGDPASAEIFKSKGINHYYIKPGVYKPECYIAPKTQDLDVVFVGTGGPPGHLRQYGHPEWPYRGQLIKWLKDTYGEQFSKFGDPDPTIRNEQLNQLYANSKVVVGDSLCLNFTKPYFWSDRAYETMGRGGFLIHPFIEGLQEEFTDGETIVFYEYGNFDQLREKIDYYLNHDDERERIRKAGHEFIKNNATYHDRLTDMLSKIAIENPGSLVTSLVSEPAPIKINLGSGNDALEGHVNVDMLQRDDVDVVHNLMDFPYPFDDSTTMSIKAIDVIEHLDHYTSDKRPTIVAFVEECHRILQPGGELYIQTPSWDSELFKIDPTHVRGFHAKSMDFFDPDTEYGKIRDFYSEAKFRVRCEELENKNLRFWMVKL